MRTRGVAGGVVAVVLTLAGPGAAWAKPECVVRDARLDVPLTVRDVAGPFGTMAGEADVQVIVGTDAAKAPFIAASGDGLRIFGHLAPGSVAAWARQPFALDRVIWARRSAPLALLAARVATRGRVVLELAGDYELTGGATTVSGDAPCGQLALSRPEPREIAVPRKAKQVHLTGERIPLSARPGASPHGVILNAAAFVVTTGRQKDWVAIEATFDTFSVRGWVPASAIGVEEAVVAVPVLPGVGGVYGVRGFSNPTICKKPVSIYVTTPGTDLLHVVGAILPNTRFRVEQPGQAVSSFLLDGGRWFTLAEGRGLRVRAEDVARARCE